MKILRSKINHNYSLFIIYYSPYIAPVNREIQKTGNFMKKNRQIPRLVLASASPRRLEILTHIGLMPEVIVSDADETVTENVTPEELTEILSVRKAKAVSSLVKADQLVIASDTVVAMGDTVFGKPHSPSDAYAMLRALSGSTHKVVSGIALMLGDRISVTHDVTYVTFRELSDREIINYISTGEPFGKAGAYGIQDKASVFVSRLDGDYFNVVGLPVYKMFELLNRDHGLDLFDLLKQSENYKYPSIDLLRYAPVGAFSEYLAERNLDPALFHLTDEGRYTDEIRKSGEDITFAEWKERNEK